MPCSVLTARNTAQRSPMEQKPIRGVLFAAGDGTASKTFVPSCACTLMVLIDPGAVPLVVMVHVPD